MPFQASTLLTSDLHERSGASCGPRTLTRKLPPTAASTRNRWKETAPAPPFTSRANRASYAPPSLAGCTDHGPGHAEPDTGLAQSEGSLDVSDHYAKCPRVLKKVVILSVRAALPTGRDYWG